MQLKSHPHWLDLVSYWLISQVKTADASYDPENEKESEGEQRFRGDLMFDARGKELSNHPITRM